MDDGGRGTGIEGTAARAERGFTLALAVLLLVAVLTAHKGQIGGDGRVRFATLQTLMDEGRLSADKYSLVVPLLAVPLYVAGEAAARVAGAEGDAVVHWVERFVRRFNGLVAVALALAAFLYLRHELRWSRRDAVAATAFLLFGSLLLPHARDLYAEPLWTLGSLLVVWLLAALIAPGKRAAGWRRPTAVVALLAGLVPLNPLLAPVFVAVAALAAVAVATRTGRDRFTAPVVTLVGVAAGSLVAGLENLARRGSFTDFGYPGEGFTTPFLHGLVGQLVAPARGVVFFTPAIVAGLWLVADRRLEPDHRHRAFVRLGLLYCVLVVLAYAKWHAWHGAWYWGPRFLLPLSVLGALFLAIVVHDRWAAAGRLARAAWALLAAVSAAVYQVGATVKDRHLLDCLRLDPAGEACYWDLRFTPLASYLDRADLVTLVSSRSLAVVLATLAAMTALVRWWPEPTAAADTLAHASGTR